MARVLYSTKYLIVQIGQDITAYFIVANKVKSLVNTKTLYNKHFN